MVQFPYTKENILKFIKSRDTIRECLFLWGSIPIYLIVEKNIYKNIKYFIAVQIDKRIVFKIQWDNSQVLIDKVHNFLVKYNLIPKSEHNKAKVVIKQEAILDNLASSIDTNSLFETKEMYEIKEQSSQPEIISWYIEKPKENEIKKIASERKQSLRKELKSIFENWLSDFGIETFNIKWKILLYSDKYWELWVFEDDLHFWKEFIVVYLSSIPRKIQNWIRLPEYIAITYNKNKVVNIYIHNLFPWESQNSEENLDNFQYDEKDYPFPLCTYDDFYISIPALYKWLNDLMQVLGIEKIRSIVG